MTSHGRWAVERIGGRAAELHARAVPGPPARVVEVLTVECPAVVLGSTQPDAVVDRDAAAAAGVDVVRRRSGGGAVLLVPGESLWVDAVLPPSDALWADDVGRSFHWLGQAWADALADLGVAAEVHHGGLCVTEWSRLVCFGGLGSGEVTVAGRKVVGLSQRRGRWGARFQCTVHRRWDPARLLELLALDPAERAAASAALEPAVAVVEATDEQLLAALVRHLP